MLLVDTTHQRCSWRQDFIDEDEDGFFGGKLDALSDNVDELTHSEVCGDEVLLLVDGGNVGLLDLFTDYLGAVWLVQCLTKHDTMWS